jgi:hypothetical protein
MVEHKYEECFHLFGHKNTWLLVPEGREGQKLTLLKPLLRPGRNYLI